MVLVWLFSLPAHSPLHFLAVRSNFFTTEFLKKLAEQDPVLTKEVRMPVEWVARGKKSLAVAPRTESVPEFLKMKSPIAIVKMVEGGTLGPGTGNIALANIDAPCHCPEGATYLFLDLREWAVDRDSSAFNVLERLAQVGILVAPGGAFGRDFGQYARMCFTATDTDTLLTAIGRINGVLSEMPRGQY